MTAHEERLIDLESRLMHQEKLYEQLNEVVTEQAALVERLQRELARLKEQVLQGPPEDVDQSPPHY